MLLQWDGNNDSVDERNINAAIGAGAIEGQGDVGLAGRDQGTMSAGGPR